MIKNYEIRYKKGLEVLYLYLDYNSEFATFSGKKVNKKLKSEVKKYIKKNKINFKGGIVAIMVGGLMIGTIMLNKPIRSNNSSYNNSNIIAIIDDYGDELLFDNNIEVLEVDEESIEEKEDVVIKKDNSSKLAKKVKEDKNEDIKEQNEKVKIEEDSLESNKYNIVDNAIYINLYRSNGSVLKLELEEYVVGVVGTEMPASFNIEALKAQSVVARTYALKCLKNGKKITDNSNTQNYKSVNELKNMWGIGFETYYNKIVNAVSSTKGEYLIYNGDYIDAVYHSTGNGKTEDSVNVWGNNFSYLVSVESQYDNTNKNFLVNTFYSYEDISNKLGRIITNDTVFNIVSRNESGRVNNLEIDGVSYNGIDFRTLLGLRSTDFNIEKINEGVNIITKGYGHGVGMSQYGANGMANNGYSYKDILLHYYNGVTINK